LAEPAEISDYAHTVVPWLRTTATVELSAEAVIEETVDEHNVPSRRCRDRPC
jgi:hypothetical protein